MAATTERPMERAEDAPEEFDYAYIGPGTLAGRYLRTFWQPIHIAAQLPAGRAKPIRILGEDFTLYRGESGTAHVAAFRCAHRGTQLSTGWVEGDELRCFYHGWKYGPDGQCTEQPAEPEPFCQRIKIRSYPTQEYLGLVFAYFGEGEPPPLRRFPQLEADEPGVIREVQGGFVMPFSYVNNLENDPAHVPFVHRGTELFTEMPQVRAEETEYGSCEYVSTPSNPDRGFVQRIMPNVRLFNGSPPAGGGWTEFMLWLVPIDDTSHTGFGVIMRHVADEARFRRAQAAQRDRGSGWTPPVRVATEVLKGNTRLAEVDPATTVINNVQDIVSQWGQGEIRDREHERLGRSDTGLILLRQIWARELRALADGRPLKQWTIPERIPLAPGYHE
jgi:5,5'-dehydrodivanillate O-demethylase